MSDSPGLSTSRGTSPESGDDAHPTTKRGFYAALWTILGLSWLALAIGQTHRAILAGLTVPACPALLTTDQASLAVGTAAMAALAACTARLSSSRAAVPGWRAMPMVVVYVICSLFIAPTVLLAVLALPNDETIWIMADRLVILLVMFVPGQSAFFVNAYLLRRRIRHRPAATVLVSVSLSIAPFLVWLVAATVGRALTCAS